MDLLNEVSWMIVLFPLILILVFMKLAGGTGKGKDNNTWEDDIWNDPTAYSVGGNIYHYDRDDDDM